MSDLAEFTQEVCAEMKRRYRMALAEAGFPGVPAEATIENAGIALWVPAGAVPLEVRWRARETIGLNGPRCLACHTAHRGWGEEPCGAVVRFERDCGVSR